MGKVDHWYRTFRTEKQARKAVLEGWVFTKVYEMPSGALVAEQDEKLYRFEIVKHPGRWKRAKPYDCSTCVNGYHGLRIDGRCECCGSER